MSSNSDLGFTFQVTRRGNVLVFHYGRPAATLRGSKASRFMSDVEGVDQAAQLQLMARLTGNYKRGNERTAKHHPRNRQ